MPMCTPVLLTAFLMQGTLVCMPGFDFNFDFYIRPLCIYTDMCIWVCHIYIYTVYMCVCIHIKQIIYDCHICKKIHKMLAIGNLALVTV